MAVLFRPVFWMETARWYLTFFQTAPHGIRIGDADDVLVNNYSGDIAVNAEVKEKTDHQRDTAAAAKTGARACKA